MNTKKVVKIRAPINIANILLKEKLHYIYTVSKFSVKKRLNYIQAFKFKRTFEDFDRN